MPRKVKPSRLNNFVALGAALMFSIFVTAGVSDAASSGAKQRAIVSSELPLRPPNVVKFSQLIANGVRLGTVVWYDDPATLRLADYLELYDVDGGLVAISWFDRFGIERFAMDRAFIEGRSRLEGVYVFTVDGDSM
jgi:hypothetical protein